MPEKKTFRCSALLFDLDGVLVDSTASVARVWTQWAAQHGLDAESVIRTAHGRRSIETIQLCAPWMNAEEATVALEQMEIDDTLELNVIPGAPELLASVPPETWAIVTSGTRPLATSRIKAGGLPSPRILVTANEVADGKPSPEPYLRGAHLLGVPAEQCIVFEDTPPGIESGSRAGMRVVGLRTTYAPEELATADVVVRDLRDCTVRMLDGQIELECAAVPLSSPRQGSQHEG